jgi:aspartate-semialdehyde dehydrogenase
MSGYEVVVVGATGAVGREMLRVLDESSFPVRRVRAFASSRSAGSTLRWRDARGGDGPVCPARPHLCNDRLDSRKRGEAA